MIIKKPYAFLIKHFKLIHLLLSFLIIFLIIKTRSIYLFFNAYANEGYYTYIENIASSYVSSNMFLFVVFILMLTAFVYLLMRWKKKNRKFYIFIFIFYIILLVSFLLFYNVFNNLVANPLDTRTIRAYRDIALLIYLPQFIIALLCLVRASGFNIKQFDFKKDLVELDIAEEDQEEIEVTLGSNTYKVKRWFRKSYREFINYTKEYKYFFWLSIGVIIVLIGGIVYFSRDRNVKTYNESEYYNVNGIKFKVVESYISDIDYKGNVILKDKNYIIVKLSMENTNKAKSTLDTDILRLRINDEDYKPIYSASEYFRDLGEAYYKNNLYNGEIYEYLLIYEVPKEVEYANTRFRMVNSITNNSSTYKDVKLNLKEYFNKDESAMYNLKEPIGFDNTTLKSGDIIVEDFEIGNSFTEEYTYCTSTCYLGKKVIQPTLVGKGEKTILKLNISSSVDKDLYVSKFISSNSNFVNFFGSVEYIYNGKERKSSFNTISLENIDTKNVYIEVDNNVKNATDLRLVITIRNQKFLIKLSK